MNWGKKRDIALNRLRTFNQWVDYCNEENKAEVVPLECLLKAIHILN